MKYSIQALFIMWYPEGQALTHSLLYSNKLRLLQLSTHLFFSGINLLKFDGQLLSSVHISFLFES